MTTIAANRERMVADTRVSVSSSGFAYPAIKIVRANGMVFGACGDGGDCSRFLEWGKKGFKEKDEPKWKANGTEDSIIGLILKDDGIYVWLYGNSEPEKVEADFFAVGSGGKAARAAALMGADIDQAVELACQVDNLYSGLPLMSLSLRE